MQKFKWFPQPTLCEHVRQGQGSCCVRISGVCVLEMVLTWHICWSHLGVRWRGCLLLSGSACVCDFQLTSAEQGCTWGRGSFLSSQYFWPLGRNVKCHCCFQRLVRVAVRAVTRGGPGRSGLRYALVLGPLPRRPTLPAYASCWCQIGRLKMSGFSPALCTQKEGGGNGDHPRALPGTSS